VIGEPKKYYNLEAFELLYLMKRDSKRMEELPSMERERELEIKEVYRFSYGISCYDESGLLTYGGNPHSIVSRIMTIRERYDKKKKRHISKYERLLETLETLPKSDKELLERHLFQNEELDRDLLYLTVLRNRKKIKNFYTL